MLPKANRLKKKKDFEKVFKKGQGFKEGFLMLKVLPNNLKQNRFGIIVSRNVSKKATLRNKIKRRMSELIKAKLPQMLSDKENKRVDVVLAAIPGIENKDFWEIEAIISKIFAKAKIIRNQKGNG